MNVYVLGSAGWIPGENETSCILVESKDELILLDMGTGVSRLRDYQALLDRYDHISIILSHYHLDHMIGFIYLVPYIKGKKLDIYGPGRPAYEKTTQAYMDDLLQKAFFSRSITQFTDDVTCHDYSVGDFMIGNNHVHITPQVHTAPSFRIDIDHQLTYASDTFFLKEDWQDASGQLLLHECWEREEDPLHRHTSLASLMAGGLEERYKDIYLIHHNPEWDKEDWQALNQRIANTRFHVAQDGMMFSIEECDT